MTPSNTTENDESKSFEDTLDPALLQNEDLLRATLESTADGILVIGEDGKVVYANHRFNEIWRIPKTVMVSKDNSKLLAFALDQLRDPEAFLTNVRNLYGSLEEDLDVIKLKDNRVFERFSRPLLQDGIMAGRVLSFRDITELKQAEEALQESKENLRTTLNSIGDAVISTDLDGDIIGMNPVAEKLTGWKSGEVKGRSLTTVFNIINARTRKKVVNPVRKVLENGEIVGLANHTMLIAKDGTEYQIADSGAPIQDSDGNIIGVVLVFRDVTKEYKTQQELKESEERFRKLSNLTFEGILIHENGVLIDFNDSFTSMVGYTREDLIGVNIIDLCIPPEYHAIVKENIIKIFASSYEINAKRKDGTLFPVEIEARNIVYNGKEARVVAIRDITERRKNQAALKESERKYREMANLMPQVIFEADLSGKLTFVNEQANDLFGYSIDEFKKGLNLYEMIIPKDREKAKENVVRIMRGGPVGSPEYTVKRKDGSTFPVMIYSNPMIKGNKPWGLRGILIDITERMQAEEALRESEQTYRNLIHTTSEGYWCVGPDLITIDVNDSLCDMLGYSRQKMIGRHLYDFFDEDNLKLIKEQTSKISSTRYRSYEIPMKRSNGKLLHAHFNATTLPEREGVKQSSFALITDMTQQKELTEELLEANRELKDSQRATLNILEDLSAENRKRKFAQEEKEIEKNRAEFYLDMMGHDITNIHQGILSWIQLAKYPEDDEKKEELDMKIGENLVRRSIDLVKNVQLLSGLKRMDIIFHPFELGASIERSIHGVGNLFVNKEIVINYEPPAEDIMILAEPLIEQLFLNLIHNGVKFQYDDKAVIDIDLSASEKDGIARFEISDHGPGIPDDMKTHLFDRFKKKDKKFHAGIGLSLVKELVDRYNGTIEIRDRVKGDHSQGARFVVTFPCEG